ncbi:hypothetical protein PROFUN_09932 [Planoprotostelium fungivorum]|uniref:Uncharacterized protein n=1 Tax=Planoprotostelium fungivorum TaxID=1890364 RepID=A0A2P6NGC0_9EUKA|nr:hypothetical protein PROFUN_09932 [Planoprotostelium fungivorum]
MHLSPGDRRCAIPHISPYFEQNFQLSRAALSAPSSTHKHNYKTPTTTNTMNADQENSSNATFLNGEVDKDQTRQNGSGLMHNVRAFIQPMFPGGQQPAISQGFHTHHSDRDTRKGADL